MSVKEEILLAWAPAEGKWSRWAKPVLFSFMESEPSPLASLLSTEGRPLECDGSTALVIDLPGIESVQFALQVAGCGYRPVPLFNAYPQQPASQQGPVLSRVDIVTYLPVVDMSRITAGLHRGAELLRKLSLPNTAPPAFVLDSLRHGSGIPIHVGMFDNRSAVDLSDFPSASLLGQNGIKSVILVQERRAPADDLNSVLLNWQNAGIEISLLSPRQGASPERIRVQRSPWWRRLWFRFGMLFYSKDGYGAFGHVISSSG